MKFAYKILKKNDYFFARKKNDYFFEWSARKKNDYFFARKIGPAHNFLVWQN